MFEWDEYNSAHIEEHGLAPEDVEEALLDPRRLGVSAYNVVGEERRGTLGTTGTGRILFVVVTRRGDAVRVVTARDANDWEKRRYRTRGQ